MDLNILTNNIESEIYKIVYNLTKNSYGFYSDKLCYHISYKSTASKLASEILRQYQSQAEENFFFIYRLNDFFTCFNNIPLAKEAKDILNQINIYIYVNYAKIGYDFKIWAEKSNNSEYLCGEL